MDRLRNQRPGKETRSMMQRPVQVVALLGLLLGLLVIASVIAIRVVPLPAGLNAPVASGLLVTDRKGTPLRNARSSAGAYSRPVDYREIPQALVQATLAAEDGRFWEHNGVDWLATARAAWHLVEHQRVVSGGSTISQQLIKLAQPRGRTFRTKIVEAAQAMRLEQVWDKQEILLHYLNRLDYGNLATGCAAAADLYFSKPLTNLSVAECALLAGLPQAPSRLNPVHYYDRAKRRQEWILNRMRTLGYLTSEEWERAIRERLIIAKGRYFEAPHFVNLLLARREDDKDGIHQGARLETTLDLELNRFAESVLRRQLKRLQPMNAKNGAAVIIDNSSGGVLALVGSEDFYAPESGQVNGAWAARAAGSTFKPFTYLLALEQGASPASVVADIPTDFPAATGLFSPVNYDRRYYGPTRYRLALANSLNVAAVKVLESAGGTAALQRRLRECGLTTVSAPADRYGLGLAIGNGEARLLELANAYACLARLGLYRPYTLMGGSRARQAPAVPVSDAASCFLIADILSDNSARARAFGLQSDLRFNFPVACKTGTSSAFRDNWAFAYTPEFTVGVWVGNFDGSPMLGVSGVTGAAPVMREVMQHLHDEFGTTWYAVPEGLVRTRVHAVTGKLLTSKSHGRRDDFVWDYFRCNRLPSQESAEDYDSEGRVRLSGEYRDWLKSSDNWLVGRAVAAEAAHDLRIVFPPPGTVFHLDSDLPNEGRKLRLKTTVAHAVWSSDTLQCQTDGAGSFALLEPGRHSLKVKDRASGLCQVTWVEVLRR